MKPLHPKLAEITQRIIERSRPTREVYLARIRSAKQQGRVERDQLGCSNLAHGYASMPKTIKIAMQKHDVPNIGIITAYNDMVSAHQPFKDFPDWIKDEVAKHNATAQVAGGTPAMCDGITQGYEGMELSLFSRDVIAMSAAIGLSHQMFDGAMFLGVCDKIVPGLVIGALSCGHIPAIFAPAGPMESGIGNKEKELPQLELKIIGSMYILQEITGKSFKELREITDYILVYNKEKNPHIFSAVDMGNYIVNLGTLNNKKIRNLKEGISFGLEKFKGYCFKNVHTYSKEEFEEKFVRKYEK